MQSKLVLTVNTSQSGVMLDRLTITPGGILSVSGWTLVEEDALPEIVLSIDGTHIEPAEGYYTYRPELPEAIAKVNSPFCGFVIDYLFQKDLDESVLTLTLNSTVLWRQQLSYTIQRPAYAHLFSDATMKQKSDIYGNGPSIEALSTEVWDFALSTFEIGERILDFGCGSGKLVCELRGSGYNAVGLELDSPKSQSNVLEKARDHVSHYNGAMPLPFSDDEFDATISTEVLEHIPNPQNVISELARITKRILIITVPDSSGIPRTHSDGVVPWHLLEDTHVNFFTQKNLTSLLEQYWERIRFHKFGLVYLPNTFFHNNLAVVCRDKRLP